MTGVLEGGEFACGKPATHQVRWRGIEPRLGVAAYVCEEHLQRFDRYDDEFSFWSLDMIRYAQAIAASRKPLTFGQVKPKRRGEKGSIQGQQIIPGLCIDATSDDLTCDALSTSALPLGDTHDNLSEVPKDEDSELRRAVENGLGPNRRR